MSQFTKRTLFIRRSHCKEDGTIRANGHVYRYFHKCSLPLTTHKMEVFTVETPWDMYSITERLMVYSSPKMSDETFIGIADYRPVDNSAGENTK